MKLNYKEFEKAAKEIGYPSGGSYFKHLFGSDVKTYPLLVQGFPIGYEMVRVIYNVMGKEYVKKIIDFEKETLESFKAKFTVINDILF